MLSRNYGTTKKSLPTTSIKLKILAFLGILILTYTVGELFVRLVFPQQLIDKYTPGHPEYVNEIVFDPFLGWALTKNYRQQVYTQQEDQRYLVNITHNSRGFRMDHEVDPSKNSIVLNGDSFTYGNGVDDKKIMSTQLNKLLGGQYEVINLGVKGYGTDQEYLRYLRSGLQHKPKIVVVLLYPNDFSNIYNDVSYERAKPVFLLNQSTIELTNYPITKVAVPTSSFIDDINLFMQSWSQLYVILKTRLPHVISNLFLPKKSYFAYGQEGDFWAIERDYKLPMNYAFILMARILGQFRHDVEEDGAHFLLVLLPNKLDIDAQMQKNILKQFNDLNETFFDHEKSYRLMEDFGHQANISVLNLYPIFKEELSKKDMYLTGNDHLNDYGHELVAREMYKTFIEFGWINSTS